MLPAFKLSGPVGANVRIKKDDTLQTKRALLQLGFLKPSSEGVTPVADDAMIAAIKSFQKENGVAKDGAMKPGGATERLIQAALFEGAEGANAKDSPAFRIGGAVGTGGANRPEDVLKAKRALSLADIIPAEEVNGKMADRTFGGAIEAFQRDFNLKRDGKITPGGETERALGRVLRTELRMQEKKSPQLPSLGRTRNGRSEDKTVPSGDNMPESQQASSQSLANNDGGKKLTNKKGIVAENSRADQKLKRENVADEKLLRDWEIRPDWMGAKHPMVADILRQMENIRTMSESERNKVTSKINEFQSLDRKHISLAGLLKAKMKAGRTDAFRFPRVLTNQELEKFREEAKTVRDAAKTIVSATGLGTGAASILIPKIPTHLSPLLGGVGLFGGFMVKHYGDRVKMYDREFVRRERGSEVIK